jgi:hypothetical protein
MADSLAIAVRDEERATSCTTLADWTTACTGMDGEVLGEFIESNWDAAVGNVNGLMFLVREMRRRFKNLDRKKQVNGTYLTIRGFRSFDKWFTSFTGKSRRLAYYLLETEEQKHKRNADRREPKKKKDTVSDFLARCGDTKKKLAEIQRKLKNLNGPDYKAAYEQIDPTINEAFEEFLALISPDGYEVSMAEKGWSVSNKKNIHTVTPEEQKAKRSAAAKKAAETRAAKKAAALPPPTQTAALGECELCCDGTLATEVVGVSEWNSDGYKYCAKHGDGHRKDDRKRLIRQMSVAKVMGQFYNLKTLADSGGKPMDFGDGDVRTFPTVADYIARLREKFLGNERYDQTVVTEHIAKLEARFAA